MNYIFFSILCSFLIYLLYPLTHLHKYSYSYLILLRHIHIHTHICDQQADKEMISIILEAYPNRMHTHLRTERLGSPLKPDPKPDPLTLSSPSSTRRGFVLRRIALCSALKSIQQWRMTAARARTKSATKRLHSPPKRSLSLTDSYLSLFLQSKPKLFYNCRRRRQRESSPTSRSRSCRGRGPMGPTSPALDAGPTSSSLDELTRTGEGC